jgi:hypothetical protein
LGESFPKLRSFSQVDPVGKLVLIDVNPRRIPEVGPEAPKKVQNPLEVMGLFQGIFKVVPFWNISKHGPQ